MKIRNPRLIRALAWLGAWVIRLWFGTQRYRYQPLGANADPGRPEIGERYIYAFWHENMLQLAYQYGRPDIWVLVSKSADGQLIAETAGQLGFNLVRGSTTRNYVAAVRDMLKFGKSGHLAITPDGPRGPRRQVQPGLVYLAAHTGLPIIPIGLGYRRAWRLNSWDRFALPWPGTFGTCVTAPAIRVPENADKDTLAAFRIQVEQALEHVQELADRWAASGVWPADAATTGQDKDAPGSAARLAG